MEMMSPIKKSLAIFYPMGNLDSVPCLRNTVEVLAEKGCDIDLFCGVDGRHLIPRFEAKQVRVHGNVYENRQRGWLGRWLPMCFFYMLLGLRWNGDKEYDYIIGVDPEGLVEAWWFNRFIRTSIIYFSLELLLSHELKDKGLLQLKRTEKKVAYSCDAIIIQDELRGSILQKDNCINHDIPFIYIPNGVLPSVNRLERSCYLRDKYGLDKNDVIVLQAGSVSQWTCIDDIISSVSMWKSNWVLIIHSREKDEQLVARYSGMSSRRASGGKIIFSFSPCSPEEYRELVASADIGLAMYKPTDLTRYTGDNLRYLGLSSGKVGYYLSCGIPIVTNDNRSLKQLVDETGCGVFTPDAGLTTEAVAQITHNRDTYAKRALKAYHRYFDPSTGLNRLCEFIGV